jgi:hypothetical protein
VRINVDWESVDMWILSSQLNFLCMYEVKIERLTTCLMDQDSYYLNQFIIGRFILLLTYLVYIIDRLYL